MLYRYFTDENTLGLGKLLRRSGRDDVPFQGMRTSLKSHLAPPTWIGCHWWLSEASSL